MIAGTVAYMSPEQAKGQAAHRTSDVWAFGCVLYEMLTGKPPFDGESPGETLAEILKTEPDWARLPSGTPEPIRRLLFRCLRKDRKSRLHDVADARLEIEDAQSERPGADSNKPLIHMGRRAWIATASGAAAAGVLGFLVGKKTNGVVPIMSTDRAIHVGGYASLTVGDQSYGNSTERGFRTAVDRQNSLGGVLSGRTIKLDLEDDMDTSDGAGTAVSNLINIDHVVAVLGEFKTELSKAGAAVAQHEAVPMISHGSTNPEVTRIGNYIFRVCFTDTFQGLAMARFAGRYFETVAIFHEASNTYSTDLAEVFSSSFSNIRGRDSVVEKQQYSRVDSDFRDQLKKIWSSKPKAIFVPGYYKEVGRIARQAKDLQIKAVFLGADGWDSKELLETPGVTIAGSYYTSHYSVLDENHTVPYFADMYRTRNGEFPDATAALAYDAAMVLFKAIEKAKSLDPVRIREEIAGIRDFLGVTGNISFDKERNTQKPAVILQVKEGKSAWVETMHPE